MRTTGLVVLTSCALTCGWRASALETPPPSSDPPAATQSPSAPQPPTSPAPDPSTTTVDLLQPRPIAPFIDKGLAWLIAAQHVSGGWGAGSHANQNIRDPHAVVVDPATTAFVASALLRAGHTPTSGAHTTAVRNATRFLCEVVERAPADGPRITQLTGTQPQAKLGPLVDTTMAAQYLARVLPLVPPTDPLHARVDQALSVCVRKLEAGQAADGSWNAAGGWAPVLQSSMGMTALELAAAAGKPVDGEVLDRARGYQKGNFDDKTGRINAEAGAGVELYAFAGAQRANAAEARIAGDLVNQAKKDGRIDADAEIDEATLSKLGVEPQAARKLARAADASATAARMADNEELLRGFGSNGGEEYLSYLLTSEALIITDLEDWSRWNQKMTARLQNIQSPDGSWTGHHCITSPVFCTAAVVQCLTTDRDARRLQDMAHRSTTDVDVQ